MKQHSDASAFTVGKLFYNKHIVWISFYNIESNSKELHISPE